MNFRNMPLFTELFKLVVIQFRQPCRNNDFLGSVLSFSLKQLDFQIVYAGDNSIRGFSFSDVVLWYTSVSLMRCIRPEVWLKKTEVKHSCSKSQALPL